jgi:hypothetical protein
VVLAEMLLGAPLIPGNGELEVLRNLHARGWESLSGLQRKVPADVIALLQRLLAKSPRNRPPSAALVARELDKLSTAHGVRMSAHSLSLWLADSGVVRIESNVRVTPSRDDHYGPPPAPEPRYQQDTIVDEDALKPVVIAVPAPHLPDEGPTQNRPLGTTPTLRYRLRRPGGEVIGPLSLATVLAMLATARAGMDSDLAREDGPFLKLSRAFELTRLGSRPLYRFFEPIAVLATERHPVDRASVASHLLRLGTLRKTGLLVYRNGAEQRRIYFEDGAPTLSASTEPSELLGAQLVRGDYVNGADLERVLESGYRSGCPLGESLVRAQLISQAQLEQSLREQRIRRLGGVCRARGGELFFVEAARAGDTALGVATKPLAPVVEALRASFPEEELLGMLGGLERTALAPSAACAELRGALCLSSDEAYAFDWCLRGVKLGLVLREARARGPGALRAAAFALFVGLSAGAFVARAD